MPLPRVVLYVFVIALPLAGVAFASTLRSATPSAANTQWPWSSARVLKPVPTRADTADLFAPLGLTAEQRRQIVAITAESRAQRRLAGATAASGGKQPAFTDEDRSKLRSLSEEHNTRVRAILTDEQRIILDAELSRRRGAQLNAARVRAAQKGFERRAN